MSLKGIFPIEQWNFNSHTILTDLPASDHRLLMRNARKEQYAKGQIIFREGGKPGAIYYIHKGKVKKYKIDNYGKEQIIYVANAGELIGYHAVLAAETYPDSAAALEECILSYIPVADFLEVLDVSSLLSRRLLKSLSHEFGVLANNITAYAQKPVRERVAITLIILREKFKQETPEGETAIINITRNDIASMAGTTTENLVRILRELKDEKIIETKGRKIWVRDIRKLVAISNNRLSV